MPYRWTHPSPAPDADIAALDLWLHQSMTQEGFVSFMGVTLLLIAMPVVTVIGTPILWVLLVFFAVVIWGLWFAIFRHKRSAALVERLEFGPEDVTLVRAAPGRAAQKWAANRYWVTVHLHENGGPVEKYLTLKGSGREVELGAFLSPEERTELYADLKSRLARRK